MKKTDTDLVNKIAWFIPFRKIRDNFRYGLLEYIEKKRELYTIKNLVFITNQKCNLKCKDCANFSPYLSDILNFYDYKKLVSDLELITKKMNIYNLQIQGGEFFLHPNYDDFVNYVIENKKIENIVIATNGTIIPNDNTLIKIKDSNKIMIRISNYGKVNEVISKRLKDKLDEIGIKNMIYEFSLEEALWTKCGGYDQKRLSEEEMLKYYNSCGFAKYCLTLEDGFISICSRSTVAHKVQNFTISEKDGVNLRNKNFSFNKLIEFKTKLPPVEACYYCYGGGSIAEKVKPAIQMNKEELDFAYSYMQDKTRQDKT